MTIRLGPWPQTGNDRRKKAAQKRKERK